MATDTRVPVQIIRHPTVRLVGQVTRAQVAGELAAWTNRITGLPELLPAGSWQHITEGS